jgi:trans-aconitate 2-methyltransferase
VRQKLLSKCGIADHRYDLTCEVSTNSSNCRQVHPQNQQSQNVKELSHNRHLMFTLEGARAQEFMQWNPQDYAQHSDAQLQWAQTLRANLHLQGHEAVLDVGCGDGKVTADFAATLAQGKVVGIDSSPDMVAYAQRIYPQAQYPNLSFACMDARKLTFQDTFDLVFSNAVLHWVDDHQAFLAGAARVLKPGGRLVISCGGQGNAAAVLRVFADIVTRPVWRPYFGQVRNPYFFYGLEEYGQWLADAGFVAQRLELVPKDMTHQGKAGLAAWIRTTWLPFTQAVPEAQREMLIVEFLEAYLSEVPLDADGLTHVAMVRLEVNATLA